MNVVSVGSSQGFKFENVSKDNTPSTVVRVDEVKAFIAEYNDADGKKHAALCFHAPGSRAVFIANEKISGQHVVTSAKPWFGKAFVKALEGAAEEAESI